MQPQQVTLYLAGPMSGIPQFNYPKFHQIAWELRAQGLTIVSPAEQDSQEMQKLALESTDGLVDGQKPVDNNKLKFAGETWADIMARDVKLVGDSVDGVIVMDGWEASKGARLEVFVARLTNKLLYVYDGNGAYHGMQEGEYLRGITGHNAVLLSGGTYNA